jgi:hypothetical protein
MSKGGVTRNSPIVVRTLSPVERAWLAGVIDGEGSIYISKVKSENSKRGFVYAAYLSASNSNFEFVTKVRDIIGRGYVGIKKEKRFDWSDGCEYKGSASVLRGILPQILPHLVIKHEVARRMLEFLEFVEANSTDGLEETPPRYYERVDWLYWRVKELNQKGKDSPDTDLMSAAFNLNKRRPGIRVKHCRSMDELERAWLAGVIDGEGSIFLSKVFDRAYRRGFFYRPQLLASSSNRLFLIRIAEIIGEGTVHRAKKGGDGAKTRWEYVATAGVLRTILPQILPYLIVKRERAQRMLEYFEFVDAHPLWGLKQIEPGYYEMLDSLYFKLKRLNQKGKL